MTNYYCTSDPTSILPSDLFPRKLLILVSPVDHQIVAQKLINNAKQPTPSIVHPFILSSPSDRRMEWSGCAWVFIIVTGVDVFPFTDCGEYVENVRQNMPSTRIEEKNQRSNLKQKPLYPYAYA